MRVFTAEHRKNLSLAHLGIPNPRKQGKIIECVVCGKEKYAKPYRLRAGMRFCGRKCAYENAKGKHFSPTSEFKKGQRTSPLTEFKKGNRPHNWDGLLRCNANSKEKTWTRLNYYMVTV